MTVSRIPHGRMPQPFRRLLALGFGVALVAGLGGARSSDPAGNRAGIDLSQIKLTYTCGTFFRVRNLSSSQLTLTYSVYRTSETGTVTVPAAPTGQSFNYSETYFQTTNKGAVRLTYNGQLVALMNNGGVACATAWKMGTWSNPVPWTATGSTTAGTVAINMALLPDGRVISWGRQLQNEPPQVWNPATDPHATSPQTQYPAVPQGDTTADLFCVGMAFLADGRLLVAGGNYGSGSDSGRPTAFTFNYATNTWTRLPPMAHARWYPTITTLPNGDALIHSGTVNSTTWDTIPEVYQVGSNSWRELTNAPNNPGFYPWHFVAPTNGWVFQAGQTDRSLWLNPAGTGSWSNDGAHIVHYGRDYGSAVMYDVGKILVMGGGQPSGGTQNTAELIDITGGTGATWQSAASMTYGRRQLSAVLMANGQVLVTGGAGGAGANPAAPAQLVPEVWDPHTQLWTQLAAMHHERLYHSNTLLLPDGRILSAGSGEPPAQITASDTTGGDSVGVIGDTLNDQRNAEFLTPPYLYNPDGSLAVASRPIISNAPTSVSPGQQFTLQTQNVIADTVLWVRLGAVTHAFNENQRINYLHFTQSGGNLTVTAPSSHNSAPPGHYVLYVLNALHVPSIGTIIQLQ
jgi:hypothetical protein